IMTPKSLLRAEFASSRAEEFTGGGFEEILGSPSAAPAEKIERIIFCSGKVYYDLFNYRAEKKVDTAAIVRIEQLYPLAEKKLRATVKPYPKTAKVVWCQEESQNMGAWITSGVVSVWHKKSGDFVNAGDALFTLETDKVSTEIVAEKAGLLETKAGEGQEVKIGEVVAIIDDSKAPSEEKKTEEPLEK